jgi:acetyl esterase/lipase
MQMKNSWIAPFGFLLLVLGLSGGAARAGEIVFGEGIEYANPDNQHLQLNMARPKDDSGSPHPAVLCIHGGGFRAGERGRWNDMCKTLAERGYVAATVTYRLTPKYQFPAAVQDVKTAVRWLRANAGKYHIDPDRIGSLGDSAGGHLAQFLGVTGDVHDFDGNQYPEFSSRVQCVINYYGPEDFTKSYGKSVDAAKVLPMFLGGDVEHERKRHILASPLYWVTPDAALTLLIHGTDDKYVNYEQATWMYDRLKAAEVDVKLLTLQGAGHGFQGEDAARAEKAAMEFLDTHLKNSH